MDKPWCTMTLSENPGAQTLKVIDASVQYLISGWSVDVLIINHPGKQTEQTTKNIIGLQYHAKTTKENMYSFLVIVLYIAIFSFLISKLSLQYILLLSLIVQSS